jgi:hypothetical protein
LAPRKRIRAAGTFLAKYGAELLTGAALLAGWGFVTAFVAALTSRLAWLLSIGLLCIALGGIRLFGTLVWEGMYALTREVKRG